MDTSALLWASAGGRVCPAGFDVLADDGFPATVLARIVGLTSKAQVARALDAIGEPAPLETDTGRAFHCPLALRLREVPCRLTFA